MSGADVTDTQRSNLGADIESALVSIALQARKNCETQ
jgi:hypothetical protein